MKSRVIAPREAIDSGSARVLGGTVLPFVFRRYLDYNVFESCAPCTGRSATTRRDAARGIRNAPMMSSSRAAGSARSGHRPAAAGCARRAISGTSHAPDAGCPARLARRVDAADRRRRLPRPMSSCAASSIASSIWTTSRPTFCQPTTAIWAGLQQRSVCELLSFPFRTGPPSRTGGAGV